MWYNLFVDKLVLVVEDNENMAALEKRHLEDSGFRALTAGSGTEALALISGGSAPDLLIIDYRLPDMSGVDLMRRLRESGFDIPSIVVTAAGSEEVAVASMKLGAMDYIVKDPDTIRSLPAVCRDVLRRYGLEAENLRLVDELSRVNEELLDANRRLEELAKRDDLTGVFNRRHLMETLGREVDRFERYRSPLSFAIFDVDHFKTVNDTLGHAAGDHVLQQFVNLLGGRLRKTDLLGRYGGEEFGVVLADTELPSAFGLCEELRAMVKRYPFGSRQSPVQLTTSAGVAALRPGMVVTTLVETADRGLYTAKEAGRDRVASIQQTR